MGRGAHGVESEDDELASEMVLAGDDEYMGGD